MMLKIPLDLSYLTDKEKEVILIVLQRNDALWQQERARVIKLREELRILRLKGVIRSGADQDGTKTCARCRVALGTWSQTGSVGKVCARCQHKVCDSCQCGFNTGKWLCIYCFKQMELDGQTGNWFYSKFPSETRDRQTKEIILAPDIVRMSIGQSKHLPISASNVSTVGTTIGEVRRALARNGSDVHESSNSSPSRLSNQPFGRGVRTSEERINGSITDAAVVQVGGISETSYPPDEDNKLLKEFLDLTPFTLPARMTPAADPSPSVVHVRKITSRKYKDSDSDESDDGLSRHSGASRVEIESVSAIKIDRGQSFHQTNTSSLGQFVVETEQSTVNHSNQHSLSPDFGEIHANENLIQNLESSLDHNTAFRSIENHAVASSSPVFAKMTASSRSISNVMSEFDNCDGGLIVPLQGQVVISTSPCASVTTSHGPQVDFNLDNHGSLDSTAFPLMPSIAITLASAPEQPVVAAFAVGSVATDEECSDDIGELFASYGARTATSQSNLNQLSRISGSKESIVSCYSDAGEEHYGKFPVSGEILFGLSYNYKLSVLEIDIRQCKDLAAVDQKKNYSDPYIKTYLLPDRTKSGKRKTRIKRHTISPIYDEVLKYNVTKSELETRTLCIMVWNSDRFGRNDFLGEVVIPLGYFSFESQTPSWHKLKDRTPTMLSMLTYKGDISVCLKFVTAEHISGKKRGVDETGELHVLIKEARNLTAVRSNGSSDPFCKVNLLPDKSRRSQLKSPVIKRNCNPHWNHTFLFSAVSWDELRERSLELTIWDHDRLTSNDFLGGIRFNLGCGKSQGTVVDWMDSSSEEVHLWQAMLDRPNCWIDGTLLLRINMNQRK